MITTVRLWSRLYDYGPDPAANMAVTNRRTTRHRRPLTCVAPWAAVSRAPSRTRGARVSGSAPPAPPTRCDTAGAAGSPRTASATSACSRRRCRTLKAKDVHVSSYVTPHAVVFVIIAVCDAPHLTRSVLRLHVFHIFFFAPNLFFNWFNN